MSKKSNDDNTPLNRYSSVITTCVQFMQWFFIESYNYLELRFNVLPKNLNGLKIYNNLSKEVVFFRNDENTGISHVHFWNK